jgi:hypothetical protein
MNISKNQLKIIKICLRNLAKHMLDNPESYSVEQGKSMDRALRSHPFFSDIDVIWVRWRYVAEKLCWITDDELIFKRGRYLYPEVSEEE